MVDLLQQSAVKEEEADKIPNNTKPTSNSPSLFDHSAQDSSFADSFLDFEAIEDWFEDINININMDERVSFEKPTLDGLLSNECESIAEGRDSLVKVEKEDFLGFGNSGGSIEEELGKVSLLSGVHAEKSEVMSCDGEVERSAESCVGSGELNAVKSTVVSCDGEVERIKVPGNVSGRVNAVKSEVMSGDCVEERSALTVDVCGCVHSVKSEGLSYNGENERNVVVGNVEGINSDEKAGSHDYEEEEEGSGSSSGSEGSSRDSPSSSSSSSSSSDDDDDTEEESSNEGMEDRTEGTMEVKLEAEEIGEMEEGEIRDFVGDKKDKEEEDDDDNDNGENVDDMVRWSDAEGDDDLVSGSGTASGPIRSKNELTVLPPVPPVSVTLQLTHQMIPVGVIMSIIGSQVIVEGAEKHTPLSEGSILWIAESRVALGLVDELFGPVKNPYYVVRYNSESEIPSGIHQGTPIAFVPEFVTHVLNDKNLYKKGYDASGENDEEVSDDAEFSDDEKEAEYRRMQKMAKRGASGNDQKVVNRKNDRRKLRNKGVDQNKGNCFVQHMPVGTDQPQFNQSQHLMNPAPSLDQGSAPSSCIPPGFNFGSGIMPPFPTSMAGSASVPSLPWMNGVPNQNLMGTVFANGFSNGVPWPGNVNQTPNMMPLPNQMPFQSHFPPLQGLFPNAVLPLGQSNILGGPSYPTWSGLIGHNGNNQMAVAIGQNLIPSFNGVQQRLQSHEEQANHTCNENSAASMPNTAGAPNQFNMGTSSFHRKRSHHRGGGRFSRGRGRHQSN